MIARNEDWWKRQGEEPPSEGDDEDHHEDEFEYEEGMPWLAFLQALLGLLACMALGLTACGLIVWLIALLIELLIFL